MQVCQSFNWCAFAKKLQALIGESMQALEYHYEKRRLKEFVDRFVKARILVIGDVIMDEFIWGDVSRISPEAPVPIVEVKRETKMLGGSANVINNIASLGARPILCGIVGDDVNGEEIFRIINGMGLETNGIVTEKGRHTSIKTRIVAHSQQVVRFDRESRLNIRGESIEYLLNFVKNNLNNLDAIVISDYGKGVISDLLMKELRTLIDNFSERSIIIAVDPKLGNFQYYHGVNVITPNHHEAGAFCGFDIIDEETLERAGMQILHELECRSVLITQGKDGMTLFENGGEIIHIPTVAKKVYDVTGAGDTVIGTFSLGLACGLDFKSAAVLSNFAAGIVVGEVGTSVVRAEELKQAIDIPFDD